MWVFHWIKLSWHSCSMWDKLRWLNWFWQFLWGIIFLLSEKNSVTHMNGLARRTSFRMGLLSRKLCGFLLLFSTSFTSLSVLLLFRRSITSSMLCMVFYFISSTIDELLSVNPSANVFVFGDFNVHHSTANKYYSSAGQYEQKNKKTNDQSKFLAVMIKQRIKLVWQHLLCR